jgi:hypothetical protein
MKPQFQHFIIIREKILFGDRLFPDINSVGKGNHFRYNKKQSYYA